MAIKKIKKHTNCILFAAVNSFLVVNEMKISAKSLEESNASVVLAL